MFLARALVVVAALGLIGPGPVMAQPAPARTATGAGEVGSLIVRVPAGRVPGPAALSQISAAMGASVRLGHQIGGGYYTVLLGRQITADRAQAASEIAEDSPALDSVQPDFRLALADVVPGGGETRSDEQWGIWDTTGTWGGASGGYSVRAPAAWFSTTGNPDTVVAVIDTGILSHPDLVGRSVPGFDLISDSQSARDGDGWDPDPTDSGDWSTGADGCGASSSSWHGTHVAGTIAARRDGTGVVGVAPGARVQMVRALGACGGMLSDVAAAIRWAAGGDIGIAGNPTPVSVINMSLAARQACPPVLASAIEYATAHDIPVVVAAGNGGTDVAGFTPANCPGVIAVAATGREGQRASYSNYGTGVAISAPGGSDGQRILSTSNSGTTVAGEPSFRAMMGTSMAAPHVSGAIALLRSAHPEWSAEQTWQALAANSRPFPQATARDATTDTSGVGMLDLVGLMPDPAGWSHISGVVRRAGNPVRGVDVAAIADSDGATYYGRTGPDGSYRIGLPAGSYRLRFDQSPSQTLLPGSIAVAGDVSGKNLDWPARGSLVGQVIIGGTGQPKPGATVAVASENSAVPFRTVTTDVSGGFQITDLPPGRYRLAVSGPDLDSSWFGGGSYSTAAPLSVADGVEVTGILIVATSTPSTQGANDTVVPQGSAAPTTEVSPTGAPSPTPSLILPAAPSLNAALGVKVLPGSPQVRVKFSQKVTLTAILAAGSTGDRVEFSDSVGVLGTSNVAEGRAVLVTALRGGRQALSARVIQPAVGPPSPVVVVRVIDTIRPVVRLSWAGASGKRHSAVRVSARDGGGLAVVLVRARTNRGWGSWVRLPSGTQTWGAPGWSGKGCVAARATDWAGNRSLTVKRCT